MVKKITPYYQLPPRPEYVEKVLKVLSSRGLSVGSIVLATKLTKTQVTCTLDALMRRGIVKEEVVDRKKIYVKVG